jgi:threonine/homoserine/homoserine lactone efflux protein
MPEMFAFVAVAVVTIVTPGPDTALTVRNVLAGGRRAGLATGLGVCSGQLVWTLAAAAGVTALLVASEPAFLALKYAGAAYLVFLGLQSLLAAVRRRPSSHSAELPEPRKAGGLTPRAALRQGLVSDLSNPKMAVFFTSLLPQFVPSDGAAFLVMIGLGALFAVMTFAWLALYSAVLDRLAALLRVERVRRAIDAVMGLALVAIGWRVATEPRR